jgi:hypothetical protein
VLQKGDEAYQNEILKIHDGVVTQRQLLDVAKQANPGQEWKEVGVDVEQLVNDALQKLAEGKGTPEVIGAMLVAATLSKKVHFGWSEEELENERLGIKGLSNMEMEELIKTRAKGELVDLPKKYEGAWKIDLK